VPLVLVCFPLSSTTARYSTGVPGVSADTSWNTRYGALSSVPTGCQRPFTLASNVTSYSEEPATVAPISTRPCAAGFGAAMAIPGARCERGSLPSSA
jgi:hypothetical protein